MDILFQDYKSNSKTLHQAQFVIFIMNLCANKDKVLKEVSKKWKLEMQMHGMVKKENYF